MAFRRSRRTCRTTALCTAIKATLLGLLLAAAIAAGDTAPGGSGRAGGISVADLGDPPVVDNLVYVGDAARSLGNAQQKTTPLGLGASSAAGKGNDKADERVQWGKEIGPYCRFRTDGTTEGEYIDYPRPTDSPSTAAISTPSPSFRLFQAHQDKVASKARRKLSLRRLLLQYLRYP